MIQIIAHRDYFSNSRQSWDVTSKLVMHTKYDTVSAVLSNLDEILKDIPNEEKYNLHYTLASCKQDALEFDNQSILPIDIDDIDYEYFDVYINLVSEVLAIPKDSFSIVKSGHGIHCLVEMDHIIRDPDELNLYKTSFKFLTERINEEIKASNIPGKVDPAVWRNKGTLRLPGTINRCFKKTPIQYEDTNCVLIQSSQVIHSFSKLLGERKAVETGDAVDPDVLREYPAPDSEYILKECHFLKWAFEYPAEVTEPQWYAALSIVAHLDNGKHLAHTMSKGHPGYSVQETDLKIQQAIASSGPRSCANIDTLSDKCKTCPHNGKVQTPIFLKGENFIRTEKTGFWDIAYKDGVIKHLRPNYEDLRRYFNKKHQYISTTSGSVFVFNSKYWEEMHLTKVKEFIQDNLDPAPNSNQVNEFINLVLRTNVKEDSWFSTSTEHKINLNNGILNLENMDLSVHDKENGFKYVLEHDFDPKAPCPTFDAFLKEVTCNRKELEDVLLEFVGYSISGMPYIHHKALILSGEGSNGKSTFIDVIRKLVGKEAYSSLMLNEMNQEYKRSLMIDKLFNISSETPVRSLSDSSYFKILTSGDTYTAREIYKSPVVIHNNKTKIILACNDLPETSDMSTGFARRLMIVPFEAYFSDDIADKNIGTKLASEMSGILNRVIEAYKRLVKNGGFTNSEIIKEQVREYQRGNNTLADWFDSCCEFDDMGDAYTKTDEAYNSYVDYCKNLGKRNMPSKTKFSQELKRFNRRITVDVFFKDKKTIRAYKNMILTKTNEFSHTPKKDLEGNFFA